MTEDNQKNLQDNVVDAVGVEPSTSRSEPAWQPADKTRAPLSSEQHLVPNLKPCSIFVSLA